MRKKTLFVPAIAVLFAAASWAYGVVVVPEPCGSYEFVTAWGSQGTGPGEFDTPYGVAVDPAGDIYVSDRYNHRIQKFSSDGTYITEWGGEGSNEGQFQRPYHIAIDSAGYVYVADYYNLRVQKFSDDGTFVTMWDVSSPYGVAVDSSGYVYVSSHGGDSISKFTSDGTYVTSWGGGHGSGDYEFKYPNGIDVGPSGNVYVTDLWNHRVQIFSDDGILVDTWDYYDIAYDVAVDPLGFVYLTNNDDDSTYKIQKFASDGTLVTEWGTGGIGDGQFDHPQGIALDSQGNVYVTDEFNCRVQKFVIPEPATLLLLSLGGAVFLRSRRAA